MSKKYGKHFGQIVLGLLVGSLLQLILPFLTQSIVDVGIKNQNIGFIWLILLGQLVLTIAVLPLILSVVGSYCISLCGSIFLL